MVFWEQNIHTMMFIAEILYNYNYEHFNKSYDLAWAIKINK